MTSVAVAGWGTPVARTPPIDNSELVPDGPQQLFAVGHVGLGLNATWRQPVDHADDAATELAASDDELDRVGGGAEDAAHLGDVFDRVEDVHGVAVLEKHEEGVTRCHGKGVLGRQIDEAFIVAGPAYEAGAGRLAERHTEAQLGG